jgi:hypothetical protein
MFFEDDLAWNLGVTLEGSKIPTFQHSSVRVDVIFDGIFKRQTETERAYRWRLERPVSSLGVAVPIQASEARLDTSREPLR